MITLEEGAIPASREDSPGLPSGTSSNSWHLKLPYERSCQASTMSPLSSPKKSKATIRCSTNSTCGSFPISQVWVSRVETPLVADDVERLRTYAPIISSPFPLVPWILAVLFPPSKRIKMPDRNSWLGAILNGWRQSILCMQAKLRA